MKNLVLKEKQDFMGIKIPVIEGGFGEGQKVVLAKTVAEIHQYENGEKSINLLINRNIDRFDSNDLINLCNESFKVSARNLGFITSNAQKQCYLLSQRGYTKLVAMMDNSNDKKWDVMNNLIDDYFNMRNQLSSGQAPKQLSAREKLELHYQFSEENAKRIDSLEIKFENVEERLDNQTLSTAQTKKIKKIANKIAVPLVGGKGSNAYEPMIRKVYKDIYKQLFRELGVNASDEIKVKDFNFALEVMENYKIATALKNEIDMLNNQSKLNIQ
ncbi:ORF6C domain-containing protein [Clostridium perfringens]|uniref:ORF6C domain-containing protein n=1 Tax=Clostridium perfringens TaxID=1502 RepID=UPI0024498A01|nr:ORF6C domain-containing protein [Clostridium perfringens]MDH2474288.1 ORF6C domain-containing protein [Clostridium perfringens]